MIIGNNQNLTRMHSSRMHTAHLLPVSPSMYCSGDVLSQGVYLPMEGVPAQGGCTCPVGCTCPGGCTCLGGVPALGLCLSRGCTCQEVYLPGVYLPGGVPAQGVPAQVLVPPVNRMTDRCKNITLPQTSLRAVISILPRISRINYIHSLINDVHTFICKRGLLAWSLVNLIVHQRLTSHTYWLTNSLE